jgi:hypothetical protein
MRRVVLSLSSVQEAELVHLRAHHPKAYVREQAAALLKVAAGATVPQVARHGLYRPRLPATLRAWIRRYQAAGVAGLRVRPGRGRKPAFSPAAAQRR